MAKPKTKPKPKPCRTGLTEKQWVACFKEAEQEGDYRMYRELAQALMYERMNSEEA